MFKYVFLGSKSHENTNATTQTHLGLIIIEINCKSGQKCQKIKTLYLSHFGWYESNRPRFLGQNHITKQISGSK